MSSARRAYDILRGYINREFDRIQDVARSSAEDELNQALDGPVMPTQTVGRDFDVVILTDEEKAREILGVGPAASFEEIKKAFNRLNERSDPAKFPEGSAEARKATEIRSRVHKAYRILSDKFDVTERRFRSLEID
jgi:hypothetical protein